MKDGCHFAISEIILGVHCIAVPILNYAGYAVGAISVAGTSPKGEGERLELLVQRMRRAGEYLSRRMGYVPRDGAVAPRALDPGFSAISAED
jgi:DNA-binding IclR family transcriptional regulator